MMRMILWFVFPLIHLTSYELEIELSLTDWTDLATMEEGNRLRVFAANNSHNLHSQNALRDNECSHSNPIQQFLYGHSSIYRHPIHHRGDFVTRKYNAFASHREADHLRGLGLPDVDWCAMEYARFYELQMVYGQQGDAGGGMGGKRGAGFGIGSGYFLRECGFYPLKYQF